MPEVQRRLILANGEKYVKPVEKSHAGRPPEYPRSYEAARDLMKREVNTALNQFNELPSRKRMKNEAVFCLRLHPDMTAKSYDPQFIFAEVPELENVGSRNYRVAADEIARTARVKRQLEKEISEVTGRLVFVRSSDAGFRRLLTVLDKSERSLTDAFRKEIQTFEKFNMLSQEEQLSAFAQDYADWQDGRVEIVLHPSRHSELEQTHFLKELFREAGVACGRPRVASYANGPLFISCHLNRKALEAIAGANPLRTAQPLVFGGFESIRSAGGFPTPPPPVDDTRSTIKVGMFDGGVDVTHPLFKGRVEEDLGLSAKTPGNAAGVAHGTAVAGALLYGPLNGHDAKSPLPLPPVQVVSIRVLPTSNPADIDLYESIDLIESAVPVRTDLKVYNISFGPRGPILDDSISRFTYALDLLAVNHKVTFCVAVGNDGDAGPGLSRIQSPSDLANGLGVGAYSVRKGSNVHAPYSCQGPGRECAKIKPDVVAFGGCDETPIQLVAVTPGVKALSAGTSFSSPIVASLCSQAAESFDRSTALLGRALVVHTAEHPDGSPDHLLGHGIVPASIDEILRCNAKEVTIVFQGAIPAMKMVKLPVMLPPGLVTVGKVRVKWTVAALPLVAPNHPFDYTTLCIEDTFYPNSQVFNFTSPNPTDKALKLHIHADSAEIARLVGRGWKKSTLPVSESGNQYKTESEQRSNYKWESIVRHEKSKMAVNLHEPMLVLHAIPRHNTMGSLDYVAIVTVEAAKFSGDLYTEVVRHFPVLQPVRLRTEAELRIRI
jgi:hypothetical protein